MKNSNYSRLRPVLLKQIFIEFQIKKSEFNKQWKNNFPFASSSMPKILIIDYRINMILLLLLLLFVVMVVVVIVVKHFKSFKTLG